MASSKVRFIVRVYISKKSIPQKQHNMDRGGDQVVSLLLAFCSDKLCRILLK